MALNLSSIVKLTNLITTGDVLPTRSTTSINNSLGFSDSVESFLGSSGLTTGLDGLTDGLPELEGEPEGEPPPLSPSSDLLNHVHGLYHLESSFQHPVGSI